MIDLKVFEEEIAESFESSEEKEYFENERILEEFNNDLIEYNNNA